MTHKKEDKLAHFMQQLLDIKHIMYQADEIREKGLVRCGEYVGSTIADLLTYYSAEGRTIKISH